MFELSSIHSEWKRRTLAGDSAFEAAQLSRNDYWGVDGIRGGDAIRNLTEELLDSSPEEWAKDRKTQGLSTHMIELLGGAYFVDDFSHVDSVLGVRLFNQDYNLMAKYEEMSDKRFVGRLKKILSTTKRSVVEGNVYRQLTWLKIRKELAKHFTSTADLIIFKPAAGLRIDSEDNLDFLTLQLFQLFKKAYDLLSSRNGIMLVHVDISLSRNLLPFIEHLSKVEGIEVTGSLANHFKLVKTEKAPRRINIQSLVAK